MKLNRQNTRTNRKMYQQILFMVGFVVGITIFVLTIVNSVVLRYVSQKNAINSYQKMNELTIKYVEKAIDNIETGVNRTVFDSDFQIALREYVKDPTDKNQEMVQQKLASSLVISDLYNGVVSNVIIFDKEGNYVASMRGYNEKSTIIDENWKYDADKLCGRSLWLGLHSDADDVSLKNKKILSIVKALYSSELSGSNEYYGKQIGYVLTNINETDFAGAYKNMSFGETGSILFVDEENRIVSAKDKELIGQEADKRILIDNGKIEVRQIDGEQTVLSAFYNEDTNWKIIVSVLSRELVPVIYSQIVNLVIISISVFIMVYILIWYLTKGITQPLTKLQEQMKKVEEANFEVSLENEEKIEEINDLNNGFNIMVRKLEDLMERVYESGKREQQLKLSITEARLSILQNQMNPHFLYNTLDSIGWMALINGNMKVSQMVSNLGDIFRASVKMDTFVSTVSEEVSLLNKYIYIQKIRHDTKLEVSVDVEDGVQECGILKFMLQPFVENAIVHGIKGDGTVLNIVVAIKSEENYLVTEVEDNGNGMDEVIKDRMFREKESWGKTTGTGCYNVYRRLELVYKDSFQCNVESEVDKGTRITIKLPLNH